MRENRVGVQPFLNGVAAEERRSRLTDSVQDRMQRRFSYTFLMIVKAIVHPVKEGGFWAEVPALPGCATQGESLDKVRGNLQEAIRGWLEAGNSTGETT